LFVDKGARPSPVKDDVFIFRGVSDFHTVSVKNITAATVWRSMVEDSAVLRAKDIYNFSNQCGLSDTVGSRNK
jgi:hypothetical protein